MNDGTHDNILVVLIFFVIFLVIVIVEIYAAALFILVVIACPVWHIDFVLFVLVYGPARGLGGWRDVILVDFRRGVEVFLFLFRITAVGRHVYRWVW